MLYRLFSLIISNFSGGVLAVILGNYEEWLILLFLLLEFPKKQHAISAAVGVPKKAVRRCCVPVPNISGLRVG
jgi:hypothetical protein